MDAIAVKVMASHASDDMESLVDSSASRRLFVAAVVCAALAFAALAIDLPVAQYMRSHGLGGELARVVRLSEVFGWGGTVTIIILTVVVLDGRGWRILLPLAIPSLGAGLIADGVKLLVGRWRPSAPGTFSSPCETFIGWLPLLRETGATGSKYAMQSFPSAHSATATGLAVALSLLYPRGRWMFALFALLAMLQRVEGKAHYCSDVLAGAAIGLFTAATVQCLRFKVQGSCTDLGSATSSES
jgi:membrane-associated phospholipid phosphatase